jgi:hypothetical protein
MFSVKVFWSGAHKARSSCWPAAPEGPTRTQRAAQPGPGSVEAVASSLPSLHRWSRQGWGLGGRVGAWGEGPVSPRCASVCQIPWSVPGVVPGPPVACGQRGPRPDSGPSDRGRHSALRSLRQQGPERPAGTTRGSLRRPHPYHSCCRAPTRGVSAGHSDPGDRECQQTPPETARYGTQRARRISAPPARISAHCPRRGKRLRWPAGGAQPLRGLRYPRMATTPA